MGLFRKKTATRLLENRLGALTLRVAQLERDSRKTQLEFLETYDKVARMMSRNAKRAAVDRPPPPPPDVKAPDAFSGLDKISAQILRRRANGVL